MSLAFGIGACLAAFQLIDALLLRTVADRGPGSPLRDLPPGIPGPTPSPLLARTWAVPAIPGNASRCSESSQPDRYLQNAERVEITLRSDSEMERAHVQYVSGDMFDTFGLHAASGRLLSQNDDFQAWRPSDWPSCHTITGRGVLRKIRELIGRTFRLTNNLTGHSHLPDRGCGGGGLHRHRARQGGRYLPPRHDALGDVFIRSGRFSERFVTLQAGYIGLCRARPSQRDLWCDQRVKGKSGETDAGNGPCAARGVSAMQKNYRTSLAALGVLVVLVLLIALRT